MTTDYNNGKIYKIVDNTSDMIYVGSTCKTLEKRLKQHESHYKSFISGKQISKLTSFTILDNNNYKIELLKLYPCSSRKELNIQEGEVITSMKNNGLNIVNKNLAGRTKSEYYSQYSINNKELIAQYYKNNKESLAQDYKINRDKILNERKKYYQNNKNCINKNTKEYYLNNKDNLKQKATEYYQNNKDKIKEYNNRKQICSCGIQYSTCNKKQHEKSNKHQDYIKNISTINNIGNNYNITINLNNIEDLQNLDLDFLQQQLK